MVILPPLAHDQILHRLSMHQQAVNDAELLTRTPSGKDNAEEYWTLERVIEFLRQNGFGEAWQQAFRDADIHGDKFRACASFPEAKKLVHFPPEAHQPQHGRTLFKLITIIRKVLNPASATPYSEPSTPTPPRNVGRPRRRQVKRSGYYAQPQLQSQRPSASRALPTALSPRQNDIV